MVKIARSYSFNRFWDNAPVLWEPIRISG